MAYNYFPQLYPSATPVTIPMAQPTQLQQNESIKWVQGEQAAKSYFVAAGQSVLLMDSENPVMYIKSVDPSGMPLPLRIFDYVERKEPTQSEEIKAPTTDYISRSEFEAFKEEILNSQKKKWDSNTKRLSNNKEGQ